MLHQPIFDIAELCVKKGIREAVLCPGSRCAPLTLAFTRNKGIAARTFSDERSAGFVGLGMAQQTQRPVVLICTSGSAAYNFAPAVAEAFFSETPLIILTADRPVEWVAQHDGQTIYQSEIFGKHVKRSYLLPQDYEHPDSVWAINRMVNEAINLSVQEPRGPVHINAPFREPLYPSKGEPTVYSDGIRVLNDQPSDFTPSDADKKLIAELWPSFRKVLLVVGQQDHLPGISRQLQMLSERFGIPVAADIISNLEPGDHIIHHSDLFLGQATDSLKLTLQPDLLITFGKSLVSKNLKVFLRKHAPKNHWHVQPCGIAADTFRNLTHVFHTRPEHFISLLMGLPQHDTFDSQKQVNFRNLWSVEERRAQRVIDEFFPQEQLCELEVVKVVMDHLPAGSNLHLANSMSVRYANYIGPRPGVNVFANRGTSGIDGCSSTAVGHAIASTRMNILITGDVAFFYDRNAFWHNYAVSNLRVLLLNNHGGLIFNMIDGPAAQPEAAEYFITRQPLNASKLCEEFGFEHLKLDSKRKLKNLIKDFLGEGDGVKVLEVETDLHLNRAIFDNLKQKIKTTYEK
ncbi:MAG TPA: 2-succinyl-5-enolpyruvyl-6-hydroxy-3-cyclohexene-1-carboxylic-acid synthase [Chryseosolibacter sp.]|nr:2-succinyl-5-enolpyruvyl-6-hydroxy-3-cyclohexene-1-carboxylic-acid synthase [Chryseosolibacter sp.]